MGSFLDKPETVKSTAYERDDFCGQKMAYGVSAMQGWRVRMEDSHVHVIGLSPPRQDVSFFGVFDGHGGDGVSIFIEKKIVKLLMAQPALQNLSDASGDESAAKIGEALSSLYLDLDEKLLEEEEFKCGQDISGSTATTLTVTSTHFIVANCGDSRVVVCGEDKVLFATEDHKPSDPAEEARIQEAGGFVSFDRVNGDLAMSRAIGDFSYKDNTSVSNLEQKVIAKPDVTILKRQPTDKFVVLACDGIFDVLSNDEVRLYVAEKIEAKYTTAAICETLIDRCLELGSRDNMSVIVVILGDYEGTYAPPKQEDKSDNELDAEMDASSSANSEGVADESV
mmetsp:Transcript_22119/g.41483  ORF Transcript_22119/g.41483 Transcript_22119/m.41483 type:complete len:338 (+) Transcript_22119:389-1402(+)